MPQELPRNRLPGLNLTIGFAALAIGLAVKDQLPSAYANSPSIQLPCAFFSAVFLPLGTWLALRALITERLGARQHLAQFLGGIIIGLILLSWMFYTSYFVQRIAALPSEIALPPLLPKLVEAARTSNDAAKREQMAMYAYEMEGAIIAYVGPDNQPTYFVPSQVNKVKRIENVHQENAVKAQREEIQKVICQIPYLFGLYASTYSIAFIVGGSILLFRGSEKQPRDSVLRTP